ncbi:MAG: diaminopimelate decarboxylase [Chloroflexi bacterium]|nr:diaminopimelate decarboxylase [Chloroflexota bacterium]
MTTFTYHQQHLHCESVPLADIAAQVGTPVYVYSRAELQQRATAYQTAVPSARSLVCYAVKANGNPTLLRLLSDAGLGADVTSGGELFLALHGGIAPEKIIYSGVGKTRAEIEAAVRANIHALHIESEMELLTVESVARELQTQAAVSARVNPDINVQTHPYISTGQHSHKFGVPLPTAVHLLRLAAASPYLRPVGLAAHIGSQITDVTPFGEAARFLVTAAQQLAESGIPLRYLDVGGGLGIDYADDDVPTIAGWAAAVAQPVLQAGYNVVLEPGRSIVGPAGILLTQVVYTKNQGEKHFTIVDAGMNDLIRPTLYSAYHPVQTVKQSADDSERITTTVVGPICETGDFLAKERPLSAMQPGELLAVLQAGAYGFAMSSNYNGRVRPAEVLVDGAQFRVIRRRQEFAHLLDGCA